MKPWKPKFGEWVTFSSHIRRPTGAELDAASEAEENCVRLVYLLNPHLEKPAMVIGVVSKSVEGRAVEDDYGEKQKGRFDWTLGKFKTFYVVKQSMQGKRLLVPIEEMRPWKEAAQT